MVKKITSDDRPEKVFALVVCERCGHTHIVDSGTIAMCSASPGYGTMWYLGWRENGEVVQGRNMQDIVDLMS